MHQLFFILFLFSQILIPYAVSLEQYKYETVKHKPRAVELPEAQRLHKSFFAIGAALNHQPNSYNGLSAKDFAYYHNKDRQTYYVCLVQNLFLLNNGNELERAKVFNAIAFGNHPAQYHDVLSALLKVLQAKCDDTGKLVNLERDPYLTACIYQALKDALPHKVYLDVLKAMNDTTSVELLEAEQSYTFFGYYWTKFWESLNRLLNDYTKRSSCSWNQIINHPYNLKLKELFYHIDHKNLFDAQEIAKQDPLYAQMFSWCCNDFIAQQKQAQAIANQETEKLALIEDSCPFSLDNATHELERAQALNEALAEPMFAHKTFLLSKQSETLLNAVGINPNHFKQCYGNQVQQALHTEHLQIIEASAGIYFVPNQRQMIKDIIEHTVHFVDSARQYNKVGYVQKAITGTDCCWAFLECAQSIAKGVGKGVYQGTKNFVDYAVDHPVEALARPLVGNFILAYRLGHLTAQLINAGRIGVSAWRGDENAQQEWDQICTNITAVKDALAQKCKTLSLEESVQHATAFVTETFLDYKCANMLNKFYQTGERKTLELIDQLKNNIPPPPLHAVALTPEGFPIGIAGQAAAVATGNTNSVLKKLEDFGGGNSLFASMEKTGRGKSGGDKTELDKNQPSDNEPRFIKEKDVPKDKETILADPSFKKTNKFFDDARIYVKNGFYYYRDQMHKGKRAHLEVFNKRGKHLGEADPLTGILIPNTADKTKSIKNLI
jgi:hypothetical protein